MLTLTTLTYILNFFLDSHLPPSRHLPFPCPARSPSPSPSHLCLVFSNVSSFFLRKNDFGGGGGGVVWNFD